MRPTPPPAQRNPHLRPLFQPPAPLQSSSGSSSGGGTLDVRVIAMFAIAAGALLCGLPPLFMRAFKSPDAPAARVARAFAGGIILALALVRVTPLGLCVCACASCLAGQVAAWLGRRGAAGGRVGLRPHAPPPPTLQPPLTPALAMPRLPPPQVHIIPEAVTDLNDVVDFPLGGVAVLAGILALVTLDSSLTALWAPEVRARALEGERACAAGRGALWALLRRGAGRRAAEAGSCKAPPGACSLRPARFDPQRSPSSPVFSPSGVQAAAALRRGRPPARAAVGGDAQSAQVCVRPQPRQRAQGRRRPRARA